MCKHKSLVYIGKQQLLIKGEYLALFNCKACKSTVSIKLKKKIRGIEKKPVLPL
ncbi:MAG TPA: hypothetical protein VM123_11265 [archaeon]|nr:hypothetical protein [archaeon]